MDFLKKDQTLPFRANQTLKLSKIRPWRLSFEKEQVMGIGSEKQDQMYSKVHMTDANGRVEPIMLLRTICHEHLYLCTGLHTLISFSHHNSVYE